MSLPEDTDECNCFPCAVERRSGGDAVVLCVDCADDLIDTVATLRFGVFNVCREHYRRRDNAEPCVDADNPACGGFGLKGAAVLALSLLVAACTPPPDGERPRSVEWVIVQDANTGECLRIGTIVSTVGSQYSQTGSLFVRAVDAKYCTGQKLAPKP